MNKCSIVWLDATAAEAESSFREKLGDAQIFTEPTACVKYIQTHPSEFIFFIVSGSLAKETVPQVYEPENLVQIFLYCGSVSSYSEWGVDYCDKLMMFDHGDDLLERLWNDLDSHLRAQAKLFIQLADDYKQRALKYKQPPCG